MRLCGKGCGRKIPDTARVCDDCKPAPTLKPDDGIREHTTTDRVRYAFLYKSEHWKRVIQPRKLRANPFCERCKCAVSVIVDHIVPAGIAIAQAQESGRFTFKYAGFYLWSNLQALCRHCHAAKTEEDKEHAGTWPSVLDKENKQPKKIYTF